MANIYNFGLAGVGSQVQFGKGGTQLLSNSGTFQAVASDGVTLVRFQVADPINGVDAVTLETLKSVANTLNSNVSTLTTEVRGVEVGAGLTSGTGAYVPDGSGHYISTATSLFNADVLLDAALFGVSTVASNIETAVGLSNTGTFVNFTTTNFMNSATSITSALVLLDNAIEFADVAIAVETARAEAAEANIAGNVASNFSTLSNAIYNLGGNAATNLANLQNAINLVNSNVVSNVASIDADIAATNANVAGAIATETTDITATNANVVSLSASLVSNVATLTSNINLVQSNLTSNVITLTTAINNEYIRANAAETALNAALQSYISMSTTDITATNANVAALTNTVNNDYNILSSDITAETMRAEMAETALTNSVTSIQQTYVKKDGSVPFIGNVSLGGYNIQNIANPVNPLDAVNLQYLTTAISNLGSGFNYVGVLSNAATYANAATNLSYLTGPNGQPLAAGDYWKSTTSGYYVIGNSAPFFVEANDGVVYNTTGGFDVIAHVDSVTLSGQFIDVSGSVDTGFTVSIDPTFIGYVQTLQGNVIQLANAITAETQRAMMAESVLNTNIVAETTRATTAEALLNTNAVNNYNALSTAINAANAAILAETVRAVGVEDSLGSQIVTIENAVGLSVTGSYVAPFGDPLLANTTSVLNALITLSMASTNGSSNVAAEVARAEAAEANIAANVAANYSTLSNAINLVNSNVVSDVASIEVDIAATNANVAQNLATEQADIASTNANLTSNVMTLTTLINTYEANTVANASALSNAISNIETAVGLSNAGTFINFTGTNYLNNATSIANALYDLDLTISNVSNSVSHLTQYEIITSDGLSYVRVDDANGVTTALDVNGVAQQVMNVVAGPSTNTNLTTDFTVANTISMVATGSAANIDIHIEPKGSGQVYIGQAGAAGSVMAEPGQSLEVAGGDNTTGAGGALLLRGGDGSSGLSNAGLVQITDATSQNVATFGGTANSNTFFAFTNGSNAATLAVSSSSSSGNLVLKPYGTGTVSVSNSVIQNVGAGVLNTDAVNVGQLNNAIANAVTASQTGIVYTTTVTFSETTGTYAIGSAISGTVIRARVLITSAFQSSTSIEVGTTGGGSDLLSPSQIDGTLNGQFFVGDASSLVTNIPMYVTVGATTSGSGTGTVLIEYIHA